MKGSAAWGGVEGVGHRRAAGGMVVECKEARIGPARCRAEGVGAVPGRDVW